MGKFKYLLFLLVLIHVCEMSRIKQIPMVINTWAFVNATMKAWDVLLKDGSCLDAVEEGCTQCELEQCDYTVGFGGSPDENGETTLDAMIMDGASHDVGAVADLRRIKSAISVARKVLHHTNHSLLVGDQATKFAISMQFKEENLSTPHSVEMSENWKKNECQPNFWINVSPDPEKHCGPYSPLKQTSSGDSLHSFRFGPKNHDTIGMIAIDNSGNIAAGTSSNGAKFKIPGRVGDSPIPGAGAYVDKDIGGAAATGDGDIMMRFLPSYHTVENMRNGMNPFKAAEDSIMRIAKVYPVFTGGIIAINISGEFGAACHGIQEFPYSIANGLYGKAIIKKVKCLEV